MRSHILRDIVAGGVGALLVLALIGLPGQSLIFSSPRPTPAVLLPVYRSIKPGPCLFVQPQLSGVKAHAVPCPLPAKAAPLPAKPGPAPRVPSP